MSTTDAYEAQKVAALKRIAEILHLILIEMKKSR